MAVKARELKFWETASWPLRLRLLLGGYTPLARIWRRHRPYAWWARSPVGRVTSRFVAEYGLVVRRGPFGGLRYTQSAVGHVNFLVPKLLGSYEQELADWFERMINRGYRTVVNVGAGEGYYAVGLALRMPMARVHAFEIDPGERRFIRKLAALNGVAHRVLDAGRCDIQALCRIPAGDALFVVDCEGCEFRLLRPDLIHLMKHSTILVELHPLRSGQGWAELVARFTGTHRAELAESVHRGAAEFTELNRFSPEDAELALSEGRTTPMAWGLLVPHPT